jgi:chromosome partitioning protein
MEEARLMTHTIVVANNKGGVAKTGTTVQTAAGLARAGYQVLVVDTDPQANLTRRLGIELDPTDPFVSVSEAITANEVGAGEGAVQACGWTGKDGRPTAEAERIDVIGARYDLINREAEAGTVGAVRRLKKALSGGWTDCYDYILIDTRPDLGHLVQMAMAAGDAVVIPTDPAYDGIEGAIRVAEFVAAHGEDLGNPHLRVAGVVVTRLRETGEDRFQIEGLVEKFGDLVWDLRTTTTVPGVGEVALTTSYVPEWVRFKEADSMGVSLSVWNDKDAPKTAGLFDQIARKIVVALPPTPKVPAAAEARA